jgi:DNA-binding beta-propeller fold protein YncE
MRALLSSAVALLGSVALSAPAVAGTAWVSSNHIQIVDTDTARVIGRIPLQEFIHDMEFSPDGRFVYVASSQALRVADAEQLRFTQTVSEAGTVALSVAGVSGHIVTLSKGADDASLDARRNGRPLPDSTVTVYDPADMGVVASWAVPGGSRDVVITPDGATVHVLMPTTGFIHSFDAEGHPLGTIDVAPIPRNANNQVEAIFSAMELSPDGATVMLPTTSENQSAIVDVDLSGSRDVKVVVQDLGHRRRIQGVAWDEDGSGIYVTAVNHVVKFSAAGLPLAWQQMAVNYVDIAPVPSTSETVMVAPTFSSKNRSGGVSIVDAAGNVLRTVELPDMSPFHVAVSPR